MDREPAGNCRSDLHNDRDSKKLQLGIQARHRAGRCRPGGTGNGNAKMTFWQCIVPEALSMTT